MLHMNKSMNELWMDGWIKLRKGEAQLSRGKQTSRKTERKREGGREGDTVRKQER